MKLLRKLYYRVFVRYTILDTKFLPYRAADALIRQNEGKPEIEHWVISPLEDTNRVIGHVYLCRRERITS